MGKRVTGQVPQFVDSMRTFHHRWHVATTKCLLVSPSLTSFRRQLQNENSRSDRSSRAAVPVAVML